MIKKTFNIHIEANFGSEFQAEFATVTLDNLITGWTRYISTSHKKNRVLVDSNIPSQDLPRGGEIL